MADLKTIYQALSEDDALYHHKEFKDNWNKKYPQISKSWEDNWAALSAYFKYPAEVRRLIYTTNAVDSFHRMLRKYTKTKTVFPSDDSLRKSIYLSIQEIFGMVFVCRLSHNRALELRSRDCVKTTTSDRLLLIASSNNLHVICFAFIL